MAGMAEDRSGDSIIDPTDTEFGVATEFGDRYLNNLAVIEDLVRQTMKATWDLRWQQLRDEVGTEEAQRQGQVIIDRLTKILEGKDRAWTPTPWNTQGGLARHLLKFCDQPDADPAIAIDACVTALVIQTRELADRYAEGDFATEDAYRAAADTIVETFRNLFLGFHPNEGASPP